jgi:type II secretory pathway component PulC
MRALPLAIALAACAPKVSTAPTFDEDLPRETAETAPAVVEKPRPVAPPGKGARTGTIPRDRLVQILNAGPGMFLRQVEIAPKLDGERFVGWQLVQLVDQASPLYDVDLVVGDVLLALNGNPISRPDQLQTVWDSLRTANEVTAKMWRGDAQLTLAFAIEPKIEPKTP